MGNVGCVFCGFVRQHDERVVGFAGVCPECGQRLQPVSAPAARQLTREWDLARRYRRTGPSLRTRPAPGAGGQDDTRPPLAA